MKLFQRKPGGNWYVRETIRGKEIFQSLRTSDKSIARDRAKAIVGAAEADQFDLVKSARSKSEFATLGEIKREYLEGAARRGLKGAGPRDNVNALKRLTGLNMKDFEALRVNELNGRTIHEYVKREAFDNPTPEELLSWRRTRKRNVAKARNVFAKWALHHYKMEGLKLPDLHEFMTAEAVSGKGVAKKYTRPPQAEIDRILKAGRALESENPNLYTVFLLVYPLALRAAEASNATPDWLTETDRGWVLQVPVDGLFMPKGARPREIPVHPDVAMDLLEAGERSETGYLVAGESADARWKFVTKEFKAWMVSHGWTRRKGAHELRALQGCRWFTEQGAEVAQQLLGHASIATTCASYAEYSRKIEPLQPDW